MAGGRVRGRLGCRRGLAGWVQEYALGTGFLCLRINVGLLWNRSCLQSSFSALKNPLVIKIVGWALLLIDVPGANCEDSLYKT